MQLVVNSLLTRYERAGKGKTVVLLHGWGDSLDTYRSLQKQLAQKYEVVSMDLPGFGQTQAPPDVWTLDDYGTFVAGFVAKLGIADVYAYVGHSNGGAMLIRGLATGVLRADKAVLLAASGIRPKKTLKRVVYNFIAKVGKVATIVLPERKRQALRRKLYGTIGSDMLVAPHLQETFKVTVRQDVQDDTRKLRLPVLLIYGTRDDATPLADGQLYARLIPQARLETVAGASHFVHHDQPDQVQKLIEEFLGE